jgi:hypothetical protein
MTTNAKVGLTLRDALAKDFWPAIRRVSDACSKLCESTDWKIDEMEATPQTSEARQLTEVMR